MWNWFHIKVLYLNKPENSYCWDLDILQWTIFNNSSWLCFYSVSYKDMKKLPARLNTIEKFKDLFASSINLFESEKPKLVSVWKSRTKKYTQIYADQKNVNF